MSLRTGLLTRRTPQSSNSKPHHVQTLKRERVTCGRIYSLQNTNIQGLRLELQETERLPVIKPPLNFLGLDTPQTFSVEDRADIPGDLRVIRLQSTGL